MSNNIYLFKTQRINLLEIAGVQIIKNAPDKFYTICDYYLDDRFLKVKTLGQMVVDALPITENNYREFRNIEWNQYSDFLDQCVKLAFSKNKNIMFGTNSLEQLGYIKQVYGSKVITMAVTYTEKSYDMLLTNLTLHHINLLKTGSLPSTDYDKKLLAELSDTELFSHYRNSFDSLGLIDKASTTQADYVIDAENLLNQEKFGAWLNHLGFSFTDDGLEFYNSWLARQSIQ